MCVPPPDDPPPYEEPSPGEDELFESERNIERILDYLDLMRAADIQRTGSFEDDDQAVHFTVMLGDPPADLPGFACFVRDAWVDICLLRDWSDAIRRKFRTHAEQILNTLGLRGISLYFMPEEDTLYMCHRVFTEGFNFDVFRACVWSLVDAQSQVAGILDKAR